MALGVAGAGIEDHFRAVAGRQGDRGNDTILLISLLLVPLGVVRVGVVVAVDFGVVPRVAFQRVLWGCRLNALWRGLDLFGCCERRLVL